MPLSPLDHLLLGHPSHPAFAPDTLATFYWLLRMAWYWCLACPVVSFVFSLYLWLSVRYLGIHWNEGFSSLQHTGYKRTLCASACAPTATSSSSPSE